MKDVIRRLQRRKGAYRACFLGENGQPTVSGERALADLRRFCRGGQSPVVVSPVSRVVDPYASAVAAGRQEVYQYLLRQLYLSDDFVTRLEERAND